MHDHPTWKLRRRTGKETAVKVEPKEEQLETTNHLLHSPLPPPPQGWEHPAELDYLDASTWSKDDIIRHLITNSFSVPALVPHSKWTTIITAAEGSTTMLPNSYRIPLMFVGEFMWFSLRLVLEDEKEWEKFKGGVLHVSRLCEAFLGEARRAMGSEGLGAAWRCAVFDRALVRYRWGCLFSDRKHLQLFWETYGEQEYRKDPVKFFWNRVALKGRKEFKLDKEHIETGVTACQWMRGLAKEDGGDWVWVTDQTSSRSTEASEYLELWQRTKVWGQPIPTLPSRDPVCAIGPSPNLSKDLPTPFDAIQSPSRGPDQPTQISCISRPREPVFATTTDPPPTDTIHSTPTPVPKTDLLQILHAQYQSHELRINSLEKDIARLKQGKGYRSTAAASVPALFVPAPNFPNLSDPDCSTSFWKDPLEALLDADVCEAPGSVKAEDTLEEVASVMDRDVVISPPIKSPRKLKRKRIG